MSEREPHSKSGTWDCTLRYVRCAQAALSILTLHDQKLVALLHLQLPPEIRLSSAKASLLRVTFVLDFGVPQISIEIDGIQVQASLVEDAENASTEEDDRRSARREPSSSSAHSPDDASSDSEEHVPTVDDLANSFIREESAEEIRELAQELESQPSYMQESIASTDDGEEEGSTGVGASLGCQLICGTSSTLHSIGSVS